MPKRTNQFQDLIYLLERQIAPMGASIHPSMLLQDEITGEEREVDIVIEHQSGIHPIRLGIEVNARKRPASVTWIEEISAKHKDLPIHKSITVSKSGYYAPALAKATALKIEALTFNEAANHDWQSTIDSIPYVRVESFLRPYLTEVTVMFLQETSLLQVNSVELANLPLYTSAGIYRGTLKEVCEQLLSNEQVISVAKEKAYLDAGTVLEGELRLEDGSYLVTVPKGLSSLVFVRSLVMKLLLAARWFQTPQHMMDRTDLYHRFACLRQLLVIFTQPPITT